MRNNITENGNHTYYVILFDNEHNRAQHTFYSLLEAIEFIQDAKNAAVMLNGKAELYMDSNPHVIGVFTIHS